MLYDKHFCLRTFCLGSNENNRHVERLTRSGAKRILRYCQRYVLNKLSPLELVHVSAAILIHPTKHLSRQIFAPCRDAIWIGEETKGMNASYALGESYQCHPRYFHAWCIPCLPAYSGDEGNDANGKDQRTSKQLLNESPKELELCRKAVSMCHREYRSVSVPFLLQQPATLLMYMRILKVSMLWFYCGGNRTGREVCSYTTKIISVRIEKLFYTSLIFNAVRWLNIVLLSCITAVDFYSFPKITHSSCPSAVWVRCFVRA